MFCLLLAPFIFIQHLQMKLWEHGECFMFERYLILSSFKSSTVNFRLFTVGSVLFLYCDIWEWSVNNRVGCVFSNGYMEQFEKYFELRFASPTSLTGRFQRLERGVNYSLSALGALFYLIGSILFLPYAKFVYIGTWLFIIASVFITVSQGWKIHRQGTTDVSNLGDTAFKVSNLFKDYCVFAADASVCLGAFCYFIGSIAFLPIKNKADDPLGLAGTMFVIGGIGYMLSGLFIAWKRYSTRKL